MTFIEVKNDVGDLSLIVGTNQKAIKVIAIGEIEFFQYAMQQFNCSLDLIKDIVEQKR